MAEPPRGKDPIEKMSRRSWFAEGLALVLVVGFLLRLHGIGFGLPAINDPDELMFGMGALKLLRGPTLNPGWFGHPATTTIYVLAIVDLLVVGVVLGLGWFPSLRSFGNAIFADPSWLILPGRVAMLLFALLAIALTYRLGGRLFDRRVGLVAALLLAVNPLHISYSQVIRSDIMANVFMLLCLLAAVRISREDHWRDYVLASFWLGVAIATKWPFALTALAVIAVVLHRAFQESHTRLRSLRRLALFGMMAIGFLLLVSPYILLDYPVLLRNLAGEAQERHIGATAGTPLWNATWYLRGPLLGSFGVATMAVLALGGVLLTRRREALLIFGPLIAAFLILICFQTLIWERWVLPVMPLLAIVAAFGMICLIDWLRVRLPGKSTAALAVILGLAMLAPPVLIARIKAQTRLDDTRQRAGVWARAHIPRGSKVLIEHFAFDLIQEPWDFLFPLVDAGCLDAKAMLGGKISYDKIDHSRAGRSNVDYGTLPVRWRESCRSDYAILTQYDRYRAEKSSFPAEYANYQWLLSHGHVIATFAPRPGEIGGPVVRIVRFDR